jgi:hypothetical protein
LLASQLLTLYSTPVIYLLLGRMQHAIAWGPRRRREASTVAAPGRAGGGG